MSPGVQEGIALAIVAGVAILFGARGAKRWLAPALAQALLKRGQVKWAMRVRAWAGPGRCH